jgi:DNA (cytosine-5)-methyltransferase 1
MPIQIIDLFAGPGGLGEGFSSVLNAEHQRIFKIKLSIERNKFAHQTLELRAFFRGFSHRKAPDEYYEYLRGNPKITRNVLFDKFEEEAKISKEEAWLAELGKEPVAEVKRRIQAALGRQHEKWVLIGGPPCQAYSLLGRWREKKQSDLFEKDARHFLYRQYLQILAVHQPPVFVMENVKGLLSTTVNKERMADRIFSDLRHPLASTGLGGKGDLEYNFFPLIQKQGALTVDDFDPSNFIIHAENLGIPQARHRVIILGVRSDWKRKPGKLNNQQSVVTIEDVIGDLPKLRSGLSKEADSNEAWRSAIQDIVGADWLGDPKISLEFVEALEKYTYRIGSHLERGKKFLEEPVKPAKLSGWFFDPKLKGVCNHETRSHIRADLHRYFFASVYAKQHKQSPVLEDFPKALLPLHKNIEAALKKSKFNDRFRVQVADRPSTTVVSHIAKDGHYYIHYDPAQCRSLTVREAARLQTFPDNYYFEGPRTEQYHQVGNAVPPLLAKQIAGIVADLFN